VGMNEWENKKPLTSQVRLEQRLRCTAPSSLLTQ